MSRGNGGGQWNNRVSYSQLMALANYFEEHPYLARGLSRSKEDRHKSSQLWEEVALILNSQGSGSIKTPLMWSKYWTDLKSKLKIRNALSKKSDTGTSVFEFSEVEKKFFVLLGPDFGAEVPVNTFLTQPSSSSTCSNDEDIAPYIKNELIMEIKEENEEIDYGSHANSDHLYTVETVRQHSPPASSPPPDSPPPVSPPPASPPPASPPRTRSAASASSPPRKDSTKTRNRRRTRPQTQLDAARTILVDIEKDRVQAEMTTALALKDIAQYQERRAIAEERNAMARERLALVEQRRLSLQLRDFNKRLKLYF